MCTIKTVYVMHRTNVNTPKVNKRIWQIYFKTSVNYYPFTLIIQKPRCYIRDYSICSYLPLSLNYSMSNQILRVWLNV